MEQLAHALLALVVGVLGALGGLGGAILLVPALVVSGTPASEAAPLGLVTVAAVSVAAAPRQLRDRLVNHRIGAVTELVASTGAVAGAIVSGLASERFLTFLLAAIAALAAVAAGRGSVADDRPDPDCVPDDVGERVGGLAGAYPLSGTGRGAAAVPSVVPYRPRRVAPTLSLMAVVGLVAGTSGVSGGFLKTPAMNVVMGVPLKVAAATTTFTVGITASAALVVFVVQGRVDPTLAGAVVVGSLVGGAAGARLQSSLPVAFVRRAVGVLLTVVAVVLVVRS